MVGCLIFCDVILLLFIRLANKSSLCPITPKTVFVSATKASWGKFKGLGIVFKGCAGSSDSELLSVEPSSDGICEGCALR